MADRLILVRPVPATGVGGGGGVTDHGALTGLADDDHAQYLTSARHGAITGNPHSTTAAQVGADPAGTASSAISAHVAAVDPHADRAYTDAQIAAMLTTAFDFKASVRVATTGNVTLSGLQTIDGITVVAGDRVLVRANTTTSQNGIWLAAVGAWTRATDADQNSEVTAGLAVPVEQGTANGGRLFMLTTPNPITVGTTGLTFTRVDAGTLAAASNLSDLTDAAQARTNLGLGTAAQQPATAFETAGAVTTHVAAADPHAQYALEAQPVNAQTGTTYTLVLADGSRLVTCDNAAAITVTVPTNATAAIPVGTYVDLMQLGTGQITVAAAGGVTLRVSGLTAKARAQFSRLGLQKIGTDTWSLFGDLAAS